MSEDQKQPARHAIHNLELYRNREAPWPNGALGVLKAFVDEAIPSPSPASYADPRETPWYLVACQMGNAFYNLTQADGVPEVWKDSARELVKKWDKSRSDLASTRTASDTRTAAGPVECDSAVPAEPASQHDAIAAARARLEAKWDADGDCGSCGWHAALYEHNVEDWEIEHALEQEGGLLKLSCANKDDDDRGSHRGVKINIAPPREESAPAGPACQGGNTQPVSVESARPAEVDVEAERELFEAAYFACNLALLPPIGSDGRPIYANRETDLVWQGWLAAHTQADAGKAE